MLIPNVTLQNYAQSSKVPPGVLAKIYHHFLSLNLLRMMVFVVSSLLVMPASYAAQETPQEALKIIMNLYKARDFNTLFRERYTELHKAKSEDEVKKIISRYAGKFAGDRLINKVVQIYSEALKSTPKIVKNPYPQVTETDKMAEFPITKNVLRVYLMKNGKWGFHL